MPWSVLGTKCVYEDEVKWEEMFGHLWCIHAIQLGVRTYHKYIFMTYATSCAVLFSIPFHDISGIETVYMCMRDVQQRICERIVTVLQQWTPPIEITTHSAYSILLCFMCLYVFVCVQPAVVGGRGRNIYYTVFSTRNQIPYIYTQIFYFYYDCQERSTRIFKKFIGR